jgi:hypothetical protein
VAGLGCQGGLAGKALQLRVFAPLLFISAPPVPLTPQKKTKKTKSFVVFAAFC